jgi:hypothetical protein
MGVVQGTENIHVEMRFWAAQCGAADATFLTEFPVTQPSWIPRACDIDAYGEEGYGKKPYLDRG